MEFRNVQRLAGVADVVRDNSGSADKLVDLVVRSEIDHQIEDLPHTDRERAAAVLADSLVKCVPHVGIDILLVFAKR